MGRRAPAEKTPCALSDAFPLARPQLAVYFASAITILEESMTMKIRDSALRISFRKPADNHAGIDDAMDHSPLTKGTRPRRVEAVCKSGDNPGKAGAM